MFQRILVPLDGSERAELALPVAVRLVRAIGGSLFLLRVATLPADRVWYALEPPFRTRELLTREMRAASTYLTNRAWSLELAGIEVQTSIMAGLPVEQVLSCIEEQGIDLVVMCSRGESHVRHRMVGSVAQRILRQSSVPVLVLQEATGQRGLLYPQKGHTLRIMVPLDGSAAAERVITPAAFLAAALAAPAQGQLHLVQVLSSLAPAGAMKQIRQRTEEEAHAYLQTASQLVPVDALGHLKLSVHTSVLFDTDTVSAIVHAAEGRGESEGAGEACDVLALTPYGSSQAELDEASSIAERLLLDTCLPVLLIPRKRAEKKQAKKSAENRGRSLNRRTHQSH